MQNLDHLGIVAGLVDELEIVEQINQHLGQDPRERISPGVAVKAMILNSLGSQRQLVVGDAPTSRRALQSQWSATLPRAVYLLSET